MLKTTAIVEHRDHVPYGYIAIKFCHVDFSGFRADEMEEKWANIKRERYIKYAPLYNKNEAQIKTLHYQLNAILAQKESILNSNSYPLRYEELAEISKLWNELSKQADELNVQLTELEKENKIIGEKRFFDIYECQREIKNFLQQNGFVLTHTSSKGNKCVTEIEVWTLEE